MWDKGLDLPDMSEPAVPREEKAPDEYQPFSPGDHLDDFDILEEVGRGGMGIVYKAYERSLKRVVALKILHPTISCNPSLAKRFRREAVLAANLSHPSIVPVFHIDQEDEPRYFTMEFVQGSGLDNKIKQEGFLGSAEATRIVLQACEALHYAHEHGVIHRDIKPSNILLQNHLERVRITDFGIAQDVTGRLAEVTTTEGMTPGTPAFMSPEQNLGEVLDRRTDIYSLGMTFYYMLTGQPAYRARNRAELAVAVQRQSPSPPSILNPDVPKVIDQIALKMIAVDRQTRYQDCSAVAADLHSVLRSQGELAIAARKGRGFLGIFFHYALPICVVGVALVLAILGLNKNGGDVGLKPQVPVVRRFAINGGAATTESQLVTLDNAAANTPTHYMASENADFSGAEWQTHSIAPQLTLSSGHEQKTVYFKTKNAAGESNVVSDAITLKDATYDQPPAITQFAINSDMAITESHVVTLNNTTTNNPTHYMASENADFSGAAWQTYLVDPQFSLSAGGGQKTVHFKTKNAAGESNVLSDTIAAAIYKLSAFLPARDCYGAGISPDGSIIYTSVHLGDLDEGVRLYDARTHEIIRDIHGLSKVPTYVLASADRMHLYATACDEGDVAKVRIADGVVVKSISVGPWPVGMVFDSAQRYLYVMGNRRYSGAIGYILIIDTSTDTYVDSIGPISNAGDVLAISPDDEFLYAIGLGVQTLYKMSIAERSVLTSVTGVQVGGISISPDGGLLHVADRATGTVRVFQTSSMTETTPIPVADVHGFWVAPSGDHGLAICLEPGGSELLIRVVGLPGGEVLQTLSHALQLPDGRSNYPLEDPVFWNPTTGEALVPIFREHAGIIVLSPMEEGR